MSVNLVKYKDELLKAWKDVLDDKTSCDWALFGYEKQSNDLQMVSSGDGGLEELAEEFNCGKIMYAFCRVTDPNTGLSKFVFINWQGEGAPMSRKGTCANHVVDISRFLKGSHITVNARTDDDVDPDSIIEKVAKASASKFNFKERSDPAENIAPVSSVYKRIQPTREINPVERERFWEKEQEEEKRRVMEERRKATEETKRLEAERREREEKEQKNSAKEEPDQRVHSEKLRRERSNEAQKLISQRTINARAIFEQNTCIGQMSNSSVLKQFKDFEEPKNLVETQEEQKSSTCTATKVDQSIKSGSFTNTEAPSGFNYSRNLLKEGLSPTEDTEPFVEEEQNWDEPTLEAPPDIRDPLTKIMTEQGMVQPPSNTSHVIISAQTNCNLRARALYDYQAADDTEISFDPDDMITEIEQIDEGWWQGQAPDGSYGLFPANYVELLD